MSFRQWYLANFEKQLTGSACGPYNCNMAAAAMAVQQVTMGATDTTPDALRKLSGTAGECTDRIKGNEGTTIQNAATAMAKVGVHLSVFDSGDNQGFDDVVEYLKKGRFAIAHGDYDQIPVQLRGDKDFAGFHSVFFHEYRGAVNLFNGTRGPAVRVGDGLNDGRRSGIPSGYVWWPAAVARNYMAKFPGGGFTFGLIDLRTLRSRVATANVRDRATRQSSVIATLKSGAPSLVWGAAMLGETIGGDRRWFRVWVPQLARHGYMHASVVRTSVDSGD